MNHLLAGLLVFLVGGKLFNFAVTAKFLLVGVFWGIMPDILSYLLQIILGQKPELSRWSHRHRDNFSHSLFLPLAAFMVGWLLFGRRLALLMSLAMLTHPLIDLFCFGWGVKIFYPFNQTTYKLFYQGKLIKKLSQAQVDALAWEYGLDDWLKRIYLTFDPPTISKWWGISEWFCLLIAVFILLFYGLYK